MLSPHSSVSLVLTKTGSRKERNHFFGVLGSTSGQEDPDLRGH